MKSLTNDQIIEAIRTVYDPEIHVNIYDMGLVYGIDIKDNLVDIKMTLTSAFCPAAETLPKEVKQAVQELSKDVEVNITIVWEPAWDKDMMSDEAKLELGIY